MFSTIQSSLRDSLSKGTFTIPAINGRAMIKCPCGTNTALLFKQLLCAASKKETAGRHSTVRLSALAAKRIHTITKQARSS